MVSILMPIYNNAYLIKETLLSIKEQSYANWECVIVDDRSTDNTIEVVKSLIADDTRFQLFKRPKSIKKGPSGCRNYAFTKTKGDYIQFFDSDDIMHPEHLKLKIETIKENHLVICKLKAFSGEFKDINNCITPNISVPENSFEAFVIGNLPMMMVAPLWQKRVIEKYMPIQEDMYIMEDYEIYARALYNKKHIAIVNENLIFYRKRSTSLTNNFFSNVESGLESFFSAKQTVLKLTGANNVKLFFLKQTLGLFRQALAERNFKAANKCMGFIKQAGLCYNKNLKLKLFRIRFFYLIFNVLKKGDTKFKPLFKL